MAQKGSKNDAKNRNKGAALRLHNGKQVEPVLFDGRSIKRGKYTAGKYKGGEGNLILDDSGFPMPYSKFDEDNKSN